MRIIGIYFYTLGGATYNKGERSSDDVSYNKVNDDCNPSLSSGVIAALAVLSVVLFLVMITFIIILVVFLIKREGII